MVSGGRLPLTTVIVSASPNTGNWLPTGTALPGGNITGTPTTPETESIIVQTTDAAGLSASKSLTIAVAAASAFAPNRPAGFSTIVDRQFAVADLPGGTMPHTDGYNMLWETLGGPLGPVIGAPAAIQAATGLVVPLPPDANPTFLGIQYAAGQGIGSAPFGVFFNGGFSYKQIYLCCYVFMPSTFNSNSNNMKWGGIQQGGSPAANHILMLSGNGGGVVGGGSPTDYRSVWVVLQGSQNVSYGGSNSSPSMVTQLVPGGGFVNTQGSGPGWWASMCGQWVMCEWLCQQESNPGVSGDGSFKAWVTPTSTGVTSLINYSNTVNWSSAGNSLTTFNIINIIPYYGGGGSTAPALEALCVGRWQAAGHA